MRGHGDPSKYIEVGGHHAPTVRKHSRTQPEGKAALAARAAAAQP